MYKIDIITHRSLLECDKYARVLDKTRFIDAKERLGVNVDKYGQFFKYLRDKPNLIAVIFLTEGNKQRETKVGYKLLCNILWKLTNYSDILLVPTHHVTLILCSYFFQKKKTCKIVYFTELQFIVNIFYYYILSTAHMHVQRTYAHPKL